jgi:hypothetical protein
VRSTEDRITIQDLRDSYLLCRTLGHNWDENPSAEVDSDLFRAARGGVFLRCTRCRTERFDYLDYELQVFARYYRYPKNYTTIPGYTRVDLRAECFSRSILIRKARQRRNGKK